MKLQANIERIKDEFNKKGRYGAKSRFAREYRVQPITVYRWLNGDIPLNRLDRINQLATFFQVKPCDLLKLI